MMVEALFEALRQNLTPSLLLLVFVGALGGFAFGAMPGLTAIMGMALLIPFTFTMSPVSGLVLLGALYMGAVYGGAFPAILINAPGTPSSIATVFDGYPMTRQGRSDEAVIAATYGSAVGGLMGVLALLFLAPPLASFALRFGPPEYFWLAIFGLTIIASLSAKSLTKGLIAGCFGMLMATIGVAPLGGDVRFTFGTVALQGGVPFVPALIGLFTIPEVFYMVVRQHGGVASVGEKRQRRSGVLMTTLRDVGSRPMTALKSGVIGVLTGILPGAGGNIASLVAYNETKRTAKDPSAFGKGHVDGVVSSESANNATVSGSMVPMLTLGIPGAPADALVLAVLLLHGLRPGAELFTTQATLTYTFILSMGMAALMMMPIGLIAGRGLQGVVMRLPVRYLAPGIVLLTVLGSYAIRNSVADVVLMLVIGMGGLAMRVVGFDAAPVALGLILGPIAEQGLVQGYLMGASLERPWMVFFTRPLSIGIMVLAVLSIAAPILAQRKLAIRDTAVQQQE